MRKFFSILTLFSFIVLDLFAKDRQVTLQLNWKHQFQFAGYYVALEKGYYKNLGIDLKIIEYNNQKDIVDQIINEKVDFAVGRSSILIDRSEGQKIVAIAAVYQSSPMMLLTLKRHDIKSVADLRYKRIMITRDAKDTASITAMLSSNGIYGGDFIHQNHSFDIDDLINGKTDAMASYISNEPIILKEKGIEYNIFNPKDFGFDFYSDILYTSQSFLKKNPKLTKDFYNATVKGWKYAFSNIAETAELIHKKYNSQNKKLISLIKEGESLRTLIHHEGTDEIGCLDLDKIEQIANTYKVLGLIGKETDFKDFIYEHNDHTSLQIKLEHNDIPLYIIVVILFLVMFLGFFYYISLKRKWIHTHDELVKIIEDQRIELEKQNQFILTQSKITAVSDLLHNIAHQWRQPLSIMTTASSSLKFSVEMDEKISKELLISTLDIVLKESKYLSKVIDDFSRYFKRDSSYIDNYNLKNIFEKVKDIYKFELEKNCVEWRIDIKEPVELRINEGLFIQAVLVLIKNSIDAFIKNKIKCENRYVIVKVEKQDQTVEIFVKDSAGGIDDNIITKIFEPYFTTKHQYVGTGIGLYMTNQIINKHLNGKIEVSNEEFLYENKFLKGACFKITLGKD